MCLNDGKKGQIGGANVVWDAGDDGNAGGTAQPACGFWGTLPSATVYAVPEFIWGMSVEERFDPQSVIERELVERLAGIFWRIRRIPRLEAAIIEIRRNQISYLDLPKETTSAECDVITALALIESKLDRLTRIGHRAAGRPVPSTWVDEDGCCRRRGWQPNRPKGEEN